MVKKIRVKKEEPSATTVATQLLEVRSQINLWKKDEKVLTDTLKTLIHAGEKQDTYMIRKDLMLAISDSVVAQTWAAEHGCLKIDVPAVDRFLKSNRVAIPAGFGLKEMEKLVEVRENEIAKDDFVIEG